MGTVGTKPYIFFGCLSFGIAALTAYLLRSEANLDLGASALLGINAAGLVVIGFDKSLSRSASMRVPEVIIYTIALLGAVPGIIVGVHVFKHKTKKASFQFTLLLVLVAQLVVLRLIAPKESTRDGLSTNAPLVGLH